MAGAHRGCWCRDVKTIRLEIENVKELQAAIKAIGGNAEKNVAKAVIATGLSIEADVKRRIQNGPKTGYVYYRIPGPKYMTVRRGSEDGPIVAMFRAAGKQNLSRVHQSSAPGQAPATDTGTLVGSVYAKPETPLSILVGSRLPYAYYLEYGTRKIRPRKAWEPAVEIARPKLAKLIEEGLRKATDESR